MMTTAIPLAHMGSDPPYTTNDTPKTKYCKIEHTLHSA